MDDENASVADRGSAARELIEFQSTSENAVVEISREQLPADMEPVVGQRLKAKEGENKPIVVTITEVKPETIILDANHPLAGKELIFEITLNEIMNEGSNQ